MVKQLMKDLLRRIQVPLLQCQVLQIPSLLVGIKWKTTIQLNQERNLRKVVVGAADQ